MKAIFFLLTLLFFPPFIPNLTAQSNIKAGGPAPPINVTDWVLNVPEDKVFDGKFVVLEFWATWCGPCIAAIPHLNELQEEFQRKDLYFVSMTDESLPKINRFLDRLNFKSIVVSDQDKKTHIAFGDGKKGLEAYPMTVLIDPEGLVRWVGEPKQLTGDVMQAFLDYKLKPTHLMTSARKASVEASMEKSDLSPSQKFLRDYKDKELAYLLEIKRTEAADADYMKLPGKALFYHAITLPELFEDLFGTTLYDSDFLNDRYYSITSIDRQQDENYLPRLEEDILRTLGLAKEMYEKEISTFGVRLENGKTLAPTEGKMFSTNSVSGGTYVFSNFSVKNMLKEVTRETGIPFSYDSSEPGNHDFIINIENKQAMLESLRSYGFIVTEEERTIEAVRLVEK